MSEIVWKQVKGQGKVGPNIYVRAQVSLFQLLDCFNYSSTGRTRIFRAMNMTNLCVLVRHPSRRFAALLAGGVVTALVWGVVYGICYNDAYNGLQSSTSSSMYR